MSDPIADIIQDYSFKSHVTLDEAMNDLFAAAKKTRQQVGRELLEVDNLEVNFDGDDTVKADIIREVCKMGDKHDRTHKS